ncbi:MAG: DUF2281 domain-containing protein [Candidatus Riflebacteria bacterium]|nr:DUF2281 domain-containing protein [Candidatus Riflebacteria bacterium]
MTSKDLIIKELDSLPPSAHKLIKEFIELLRKSLEIEEKKAAKSRKSVIQGKFIGMWKDREDTKDSIHFVKNLRKAHWGQKDA